MKRSLSLSICFLILLSSFSTIAAVPPKPGTSCSKIGLQQTVGGLRYSCIKNGNRSVWSKGVSIKNAMPSPSPTSSKSTSPSPAASSSPSATQATQKSNSYVEVKAPINPEIIDLNPSNARLFFDSEVSVNARKDFLSKLSSRSLETPNIEWVVDPVADPAKIEQYKKEVPYAVQFYNSVVPAKTPLRVYIGSSANFQWIYDNLKRDLAPDGLEGNWLEAKLARSKVEEGFHGGAGGLRTKEGKAVLFSITENGIALMRLFKLRFRFTNTPTRYKKGTCQGVWHLCCVGCVKVTQIIWAIT